MMSKCMDINFKQDFFLFLRNTIISNSIKYSFVQLIDYRSCS